MEYKNIKQELIILYEKFNNKNIFEIDYFLSYFLNKTNLEVKFYNFSEKEYKKLKKIILKHLKTNMPIQKIYKKAYFYKREFFVNNHVLTPRFDSEVLIEYILNKSFKNVLDLCAGSGCLGITIKKEKPEINLSLADISNKALRVCKKNCIKHNVDFKLIKTNMFENIKDKYDLIICNPPYIETENIEKLNIEVKNFDPIISLDGGQDGLKFYNIIFENIDKYLSDNGKCIIEIGYNQGHLIEKFKTKFKNVKKIVDYNNLDRAIYFEKE
ncbi:MAG: peptide chain release factor N(5)-glutamine methyltransferase [Clostridiales bacterium]|nr:peptide chain release factor N(5)-glutamine methyltransferase [Clostridiales bacterium]